MSSGRQRNIETPRTPKTFGFEDVHWMERFWPAIA